jgi:hypothetical protein
MKEMERIDSGRMMKAFCGGATWTVRSGSKGKERICPESSHPTNDM